MCCLCVCLCVSYRVVFCSLISCWYSLGGIIAVILEPGEKKKLVHKHQTLSPNYALMWVDRSGTMVKVLCYKSEGRWFDPRWCHWNFSLT